VTELQRWTDSVPFSAARLAASLQAGEVGRAEVELLDPEGTARWSDADLLGAILARRPDWVGLSCAVWNVARTLDLAAALKRARPELVVLLGGPEIQPDNGWLAQRSGFDVAVRGEGEGTLRALLAAARGGRPLAAVPGLLLPSESGWHETAAAPPVADARLLVSPYTSGLLDPRSANLLLLEATRGCRSACGFCAYGMGRRALLEIPAPQLAADFRLASELEVPEVYLLDPSLADRPGLDGLLTALGDFNRDGRHGLFGELRAEAVDERLAERLGAVGFVEVELGLQSVGAAAQRLMGRHNDLAAFVRGARALQRHGVRTRVDVIVGLPGDTPETVRQTLRFLVDNGLAADPLIFPLAVLPGTRFRRRASRLGLSQRCPVAVINKA